MDIKDLPPELQAQRTKCEIWTRVMGYHRPVAAFNAGKQSEFAERKMFTEQACAKSELLK